MVRAEAEPRRKVVSVFLWIPVVVIGLVVVLSAYLYFAQDRMVFYPSRDFAVTPDQLGMDYDDVFLNVEGKDTVHGWHIRAPRTDDTSSRTIVILCHGNAGNISHRLETAEYLMQLGADALLWDYRGYGKSTGSPSESNLYADAEEVFNWLVSEKGYPPQDIIVLGRSLGGAVAVDLATRVNCRALVVESSFSSALNMARRMFPFLPTPWLLRYKFDSAGKIAGVSCPVLVTHSPNDEIVPFELGRALYENAAEPKQFVELFGSHNDRAYMNSREYRDAWLSLINTKR